MEKFVFRSISAFNNNKQNVDFHINSSSKMQLHSHEDYYEIFYITDGPIKYHINDTDVILNKGAMTIVRPNDTHMFNDDFTTVARHVNIAVKTEFFKIIANIINPFLLKNLENVRSFPLIYLDDFEFNEAETWSKRIHTAQSINPEESFSLITSLLVLLLSTYNYMNSKSNQNFPQWFNDILVKTSSTDFIDKSVADIYKLSNYSPPVVINAFKTFLNTTPSKYLIDTKINYACNLLQNTDYSTLNISSILGYDSLSHFNHIFKSIKGCTPTAYRKKFY